MHQYVYSYTISGTDYYIWMDGDGTEHFFPKTGSAPYEDAEGMSLKLQPYSTYYIITDKSNTQMRFNIVSGREKAWLGGLRDSMENTVTLTYNAAEGQIAKITDPAGRETNFYYTNNLLSSITTPAAESGTLRTVYFTYATAFGCLTGIVKMSNVTGTGALTQRRRQTADLTDTLGTAPGTISYGYADRNMRLYNAQEKYCRPS